MSGTNFNGTWTEGNQRGLRNLTYRLSAGNADCGQYAAGADAYVVGSIHPQTHQQQPLAARHPFFFVQWDWLSGDLFRTAPIPQNAQGVCFVDFRPFANYGFHYGRLEPDNSISMTDANRAADPGMGGTFINFARGADNQPSLNTIRAQRGVQPIRYLDDVAEFVDYCARHYDMTYGYFCFVWFR